MITNIEYFTMLRYIACGVEKTGQVVFYNRPKLFDIRPEIIMVSEHPKSSNCPIMPSDRVQAMIMIIL